MARLPRFEEFRFVGIRDTMRVFDCDIPEQLQLLQLRVEREDLVSKKMIQSFAPDTLAEARNRGFRPL